MSMSEDPGADGVRDAFENGKVVNLPEQEEGRTPKRKSGQLKTGSVLPLGMMGDRYFYIDSLGQYRDLTAKEHSRLNVQGLYANAMTDIYEIWPKHDKEGDVVNWRPEKAAEHLMMACAQQGLFDAFDRVRGIGGWRGEDGQLIFHCGDVILSDGAALAPGQIGKHVYPGAPKITRPFQGKPVADFDGPGQILLDMFNCWEWSGKKYQTDEADCLESVLLLGWIGAALLGGALDWRPVAWITGDRATGKSTLQKVIKLVMGESIVSIGDATAAGIWQKVGLSSVAIGMDEMEAEEDPRQAQKVIRLAREAASGAVIVRGGADHQGSQFMARSCFLFSSILVPPLQGQDVSRIARLDLDRLPDGAPPPRVEDKELSQIGALLRARLVSQWEDFDETLDGFRMALGREGFDGRGCDVFGTLLACAHVLLSDEVPSEEELKGWASRIVSADVSDSRDEEANHERCLTHLLTSPCDSYRGGLQETVQSLIEAAVNADATDRKGHDTALANIGMKIQRDAGKATGLCVANAHQGLAKVFQGTQWQSVSGSQGVWKQALRRIDGSMAGQQRIGGRTMRCTIIRFEQLNLTDGDDE